MKSNIEASIKRKLLQKRLEDTKRHIVKFIYSYDRLAKLSYKKTKESPDLRWLYEREYENAVYIRDTLLMIAYLLENLKNNLQSDNALENAGKLERILSSLIYNAKSLPDELVFRIDELRSILAELTEDKLFYF